MRGEIDSHPFSFCGDRVSRLKKVYKTVKILSEGDDESVYELDFENMELVCIEKYGRKIGNLDVYPIIIRKDFCYSRSGGEMFREIQNAYQEYVVEKYILGEEE